jgi:hypothetical protein
MVQLDVEKLWDVQYRSVPGDKSRSQQPGCDYRRYPASRFCMYHVTGKDALAAQLPGVEAHESAHRPVTGK